MRFIVDLYRYVIFAICGATLIGITLLVIAALDPTGPLSGWAAPALLLAAAAAVFLVLNVGALAILFSLHDRHVALVEATEEVSRSLDGIAATIAEASAGGYAK
jgi:hypothetical protein